MGLIIENQITLPDEGAKSLDDWLTDKNQKTIWEAARMTQIAACAMGCVEESSFHVVCFSGKITNEPSIWIDIFARDD